MAREILSGFGPERSIEGNRASSGGITSSRDVHNYSPPQGPTNVGDPKGPGLHGNNIGTAGTQGHHGGGVSTSGSPGIGGQNRGMGTNRKG